MLKIKPPTEELQKVAIEELGEVPARIPEDLEALRIWLQQQPHIKARTDDQFLVQFLRGSKYSLEKAKQKIDFYYSVRTQQPLLAPHCNVDDPRFRKLHNTGFWIPLPIPFNDSGPRILFGQASYDPKEFGLEDISKYIGNSCDVLHLSDPYACIQGLVFVIDCAKATANHMALFSVSHVKYVLIACEKGLPLRIKKIVLTRVPPLMENFLKILIQFLPEKIKNRIHTCGSNIDLLAEVFPKKYFPQDFGGENGCIADLCLEYHRVWDEYRQHFKENTQYGTDERLRLGTPFKFNAELGVGGSFRKINID